MKIRTSPLAAVLVALGAVSCASVGTPNSTTTSTLDPTAMRGYLARNVGNVTVIYDGLLRMIAAANGSATPGVEFTNITGGVQGTVAYDLDGDGVMESSLTTKLLYNDPAVGINSGGTFTVTSMNASYLAGTATAKLAIVGGGTQVNITSGTADFHPTWGPHLTIPSVSLAVTPTLQHALVLGQADFTAGNDSGTIFFESNGTGGWRMRVTGPGFATFTVP